MVQIEDLAARNYLVSQKVIVSQSYDYLHILIKKFYQLACPKVISTPKVSKLKDFYDF